MYALATSETEAGLLSFRKSLSDPIFEMRSDHTIPAYHNSRLFKVILDLDYWKNKNPALPKDALIWFTDGSRADSGTGSGIFGLRPNGSLSFPLGKFATVFQTEIYAILQCACENIRRAYRNKRILIFSDSQAALRALNGPKVTSELVVECLNALSALSGLNEVTLIWVPGHCGILGNEETHKFGRQASALPLSGPEPALGIPKYSVREEIRTWIMNQHHRAWKDLPGHRHGSFL
jgi:ribonuclease HI